MTTIIRKDNVIVYDSRVSRGNLIINDEGEKKAVVNDVAFFFCGNTPDRKHIIDGYFNGTKPPAESDAEAFIVDKGKVYRAGTGAGEFWFHESHDIDAIGSGAGHALTALDCGKNPAQALAMAMKRDSGTGGKIRSYVIKRQP